MMKRKLCIIVMILVVFLSIFYIVSDEQFCKMIGLPRIEDYVSDQDEICVIGRIYQKEYQENNSILYLENIWIKGKIKSKLSSGRLMIYVNNADYRIGQYVQISGTIQLFQSAPNPGNFNQKAYYKKQKIIASVYGENAQNLGGKIDVFREKLWEFRDYLSKKLVDTMGEREGGILCSILLGESNYVENDVKEGYQKSGTGHLLAISGLHISFLGMGLYRILKKCGVQVYVSAVIASIVLFVYVQMTGASISSLRALYMFWLRMMAILLGREYDGLTAVSASALIILIENPLRLFDAGFQLSFASVLAVYLVAPKIKCEKLQISMAINLTLLPLMLYYYYEISTYSMIWNLLVIPLAEMVMATGLAGSALLCMGEMCETLATIVLLPAKWILWIYNWGNNLILDMPFSRIVIGRPSEIQIILYYISLYLLLSREKKRIIYGILMGNVLFHLTWIPGELEIIMLDVGQGDSIFIRGPEGTTYLMDGGSSSEKEIGRYRLEPFLKSQGVGVLDYVFISHGDTDHLSGIQEMIERQNVGVRIEHLVIPPKQFWEENLHALVESAVSKGVEVYTVSKDDCLREGNMEMTCLWPKDTDGEASNANSVVFDLEYKNFDMLFTGDLELEGEEQVVEILKRNGKEYEVLKVGHHGSNNSTSREMLDIIRPKLAIISCGRRNSYGHPHKEVLQRLKVIGCEVHVTAWEHYIDVEMLAK